MTKETLPLAGIRVLSFAQLGQGPTATQLFGDFGAEVIKIERPKIGAWERGWSGAGGAFKNGESLFYLSLNRNNKSLTVNLKDSKGLDVIKRLVETSDILVENFRPGVLDKLGLGYEALSQINPRLIYCSASGYGSTGPYVERPGQDLVVQGLSGMAAMAGKAGETPVAAGTTVIDFHAGTLIIIGALLALAQREKTNRGQLVETNLFEAALHLQLEPLFYHLNGFEVTKRSHSGLSTPYHEAPYGIYRTADGYMVISANPLKPLGEILGVPELLEIPEDQRMVQRDRIRALIEGATPRKTTAEWVALMSERDLWCGPVKDYHQLSEDPQFTHMQVVVPFERDDIGQFNGLRAPVTMSAAPHADLPMAPPPRLGEHTREILLELGYAEAEIDAMLAAGSI